MAHGGRRGASGAPTSAAPSESSGVSSTSTSSSVTCVASQYGSFRICLTMSGLASASKSGWPFSRSVRWMVRTSGMTSGRSSAGCSLT